MRLFSLSIEMQKWHLRGKAVDSVNEETLEYTVARVSHLSCQTLNAKR